MISPQAEKVLRDSGWYPGRTVDLSEFMHAMRIDGIQIHESAQRFLREFGGLKIRYYIHDGLMRIDDLINFDLNDVIDYIDVEDMQRVSVAVGDQVCTVGEMQDGYAWIGLAEDGKMYVRYQNGVSIVGNDQYSGIDNIIRRGNISPPQAL